MRPIDENDAASVIINPFNVVVIQDYFFVAHNDSGAEEDWVLLNAKLIEDVGADRWLGEFLDSLSQTREDYDGDIAVNPSLIIVVSSRLRGDHELLVTREQWVQANTKLINELGANQWLWLLLDVLETGGP